MFALQDSIGSLIKQGTGMYFMCDFNIAMG